MKRSHKDTKFNTDIGVNATIQRGEASAELSAIPNRKLIDLGQSFQTIPDFKIERFDYRGSAAVHIYTHEELNLLQFVSQTYPLDLYKCPEILAKRGFDDLLRELKRVYGHRHGKLRSGF